MGDKPSEDEIHRARFIRTAAKRKRQWMENVEKNAPLVKFDLGHLWREGPGNLEAVSVAAGPSLDTDLETLKQDRDGRELVCVDAALKFLTERGIRPDFVTCADASDEAAHLLLTSGATDLPLVLNVAAHPSIGALWKGRIYWYVIANQFFDLDRGAFMQTTHQLVSKASVALVQGGNVSSVSLAFLLSVRNADKVLLHGHDFCWTERMYCGGGMRHLENARIAGESKAGTQFETENSRGDRVITNLSLKKFAEWHDEAIRASAGRVVNRTTSTILK